jgi:hypothetical protein
LITHKGTGLNASHLAAHHYIFIAIRCSFSHNGRDNKLVTIIFAYLSARHDAAIREQVPAAASSAKIRARLHPQPQRHNAGSGSSRVRPRALRSL